MNFHLKLYLNKDKIWDREWCLHLKLLIAIAIIPAMEMLVKLVVIANGLNQMAAAHAYVVLKIMYQLGQQIVELKIQLMKFKLRKNLSSES